jgi:transposase
MMGKANFSGDFKREAVLQITGRGYPMAEVSQPLRVAQHSLYAWKKKFAKALSSGDDGQAPETRRLKRETGESDRGARHARKAITYFAKGAK